MATRLYFNNETIPYNPATLRGAWDATATPSTGKLASSAVTSGAAVTITKTETVATNNWDIYFGKWVSEALKENTTISGTIDYMLRASEANIDANAFYHLHIFVIAGDSDTVRGTLLTDHIGGTEFATTAGGLGQTGVALSSVDALRGDRVVIEVGAQLQNTHTTSRNIVIGYGGANDIDLTTTNTTAARPKWVEFSLDIPFLPPMHTFKDNANDDSIDTANRWVNWGGGNILETAQHWETVGDTVDGNYYGMDSLNYYSLKGSFISAYLKNVGTPMPQRIISPVTIQKNTTNSAYWEYNDGTLYCYKQVAGAYTQVGSSLAYNPAVHRFFRISELTPGTISWDYSTDGTSYTSYTTVALAALWPTSGIFVSCFTLGNAGVPASASFAYHDDVNSVPSLVFPTKARRSTLIRR